MRVYIDFESRSQCDIWTTGAYRYAEDPSTEVLCLAWAIDNSPIQGVIGKHGLLTALDTLNTLIRSGAEFHAHNAFFERSMWKHKLVPIGFLPIPIVSWRDTAAKVSAHALPRQLEKAALALGCKSQKDMEGNKLMRALCTTTGPIPQEKLERLLLYCKRDVETEREIDTKLPDLIPSEQRVWCMDQYINDTGVTIDTQAVQNAITLADQESKMLNKELFQLTGGLINAGTQTIAIKNFLERKGVVLPNMQKSTVKQAIQNAGGDTLRILQLRQQLSLTSIAKYSALASAVCADGRVRDTLIYHGASTGRWTGKLVQVQNLVKATIKPSDIDVAIRILRDRPDGFSCVYDTLATLSSCIRGMFVPSAGKSMFITDFAAIEARVVMWLAGETGGLKMFAERDENPEVPDIYVRMAAMISPNATRQLGKQTVLGCGFGMGVKKFIETCEKYEVPITDELANRAVSTYRKTFSAVPRFWYALEDAAKKCVTSGKPVQCGKVSWKMEGEFLRMVLPSGRTLAYHHPKINVEGELTYLAVNSLTNHYEVEHNWGGGLVENATQAVARDIMVESMFRILKAGHTILFTVHDELVTECKEDTEANVVTIIRQVPTWAQGCPINAECKKVRRYQK